MGEWGGETGGSSSLAHCIISGGGAYGFDSCSHLRAAAGRLMSSC